MQILQLTAIGLIALSLTAVSTFAGSDTSQIINELSVEKSTCSTEQFGKRYYDRETDTFTRHCSQK